jgi:hypothetical protein
MGSMMLRSRHLESNETMTFYTKELSVYLKAKKKKDSLTNTSLK